MRGKLTTKTVENIKPPKQGRDEYWDATLPGFGLRVTDKGRKSWVLMYRIRGRLRRMTIGRFPAFTLAEAREEARSALRSVERGIDPAQERLEAKKKPSTLFPDTIDQFIELYAKPKNRGWKETRRLLKNNIQPYLKHHSIQEVTRTQVIEALDSVVARGASIQANRTHAAIRKLFNWALDRGIIDQNPIAGLKPLGKEVARDRVMTDEEITDLWNVWDKIGWPFGPLIKLLLITGQRRSEVASMKWSQINFETKVWTIPREVAKSDRTHDVPLPSLAINIIRSIPRLEKSDYIFTTNGRNPVSGFGRVKKRIDEQSGISDWRLHDLRRTAASGMARLGVTPHVVEKILNHSSGTISGVAAVYNRHGYENEKKEALYQWSEHLEILIQAYNGQDQPCLERNGRLGICGFMNSHM